MNNPKLMCRLIEREMVRFLFIILAILFIPLEGVKAEADPNFYIYLCFGQSNMEGVAKIEEVDKYVDSRFKTLAALNFDNPFREKGNWYTANPPIVRQTTGLGIADYFGRVMVAALPSNITIGVINIAIGGMQIEGFMPDEIEAYLNSQETWMRELAYLYGTPYQGLVEMGKIAQERGVIKGILMHQGENNCGQWNWIDKVKKVYESLLLDLNLDADSCPLIVGELVSEEYNGACSLHNNIVREIPNKIPNAHVVYSNGCPPSDDKYHFSAAGYRIMGKRYAFEVLSLMDRNMGKDNDYTLPYNLDAFLSLKNLDKIDTINVQVGGAICFCVNGGHLMMDTRRI